MVRKSSLTLFPAKKGEGLKMSNVRSQERWRPILVYKSSLTPFFWHAFRLSCGHQLGTGGGDTHR